VTDTGIKDGGNCYSNVRLIMAQRPLNEPEEAAVGSKDPRLVIGAVLAAWDSDSKSSLTVE
jgi:hypothetical protein